MNFGRIRPFFMIIGVQKGGTTSLHNYLVQHPNLVAPKKKELHYFDTNEAINAKEYVRLFPREYFGRSKSFESTPRYLYYPGVAQKIAHFNPKTKLIISLRNPVERAFSAWNMYKQMQEQLPLLKRFQKMEKKDAREMIHSYFYKDTFPSFEECVYVETDANFNDELIEPSIVRRGYYKQQIESYLAFFPKEQLFIFDIEELQNSPIEVLNAIADFLDISAFTKLDLDLNFSNKRSYDAGIKPETYQYLLNHFKRENMGLEKLVNLNLTWMK